jgi:glycine reductase
VAAYLGHAAANAPPDDVEVFDVAPLGNGLPGVACLYHSQRIHVYGARMPLQAGTVLHANECFDGAVTGWAQGRRCTYLDQNNQVMIELCRQHGRTLDFRGCVLFGDITPYRVEKERASSAAARLASLLDAKGAVVLGVNGSNLTIDAMMAVEACEAIGIKTVLTIFDVGTGREDPGFTYAAPAADAIVNTGSRDRRVTLPPVNTVLGGTHLVDQALEMAGLEVDASGEIDVAMRYLHSAYSVQGHTRLTTRFH